MGEGAARKPGVGSRGGSIAGGGSAVLSLLGISASRCVDFVFASRDTINFVVGCFFFLVF